MPILQGVFLPMLEKLQKLKVDMTIHQRGFHPRGGGKVTMRVPTIPQGGSSCSAAP